MWPKYGNAGLGLCCHVVRRPHQTMSDLAMGRGTGSGGRCPVPLCVLSRVVSGCAHITLLSRNRCELCVCRSQVDEVKGIMTENIEKVLARGEKLELLTDKTENLMNEVRFGGCVL